MAASSATAIAKFCTSLRKRPEWAAAVPALLQSRSPIWRETRLVTIEATVPLPGSSNPEDVFSFALLSTDDVGQPDTDARLDRLACVQGIKDIAVVLLTADTPTKKGNVALQELQFRMMSKLDVSIPVLPLTAAVDLRAVISAFVNQLRPPKPAPTPLQQQQVRREQEAAARALLPHCSSRPVLQEHDVHVLSDISTGLRDLAGKATTDEGRALITDFLGDEVGGQVMEFWLRESPMR